MNLHTPFPVQNMTVFEGKMKRQKRERKRVRLRGREKE